jgi:hypothetical protein
MSAPFHNIMYTCVLIIQRRQRSNNPPDITSHDFFRALPPITSRWCAVDGLLLLLLLLLHPLSIPLHANNLLSEPTALLSLRLALHLLRNLDVDLEELAHAAVQAHGLALVQVGFAVLRGDALLGAGVDEPIVGKRISSEVVSEERERERARSLMYILMGGRGSLTG